MVASAFFFIGCKKENPESLFSTDKEVYNMKQSIQFNNQSENGLAYHWDFGDGETSILTNPGHTYNASGEYLVTLQVTGAKKTIASEFSKKVKVVELSNSLIEPDHIFANTTWVCDSTTNIHLDCSGATTDNSTTNVNNSMIFNDNNTVLILNGNFGNICDYDILNDTTIGFYENPYYRTMSFSITGDRLMLTSSNYNPCMVNSSISGLFGSLLINHFYKE